MTVYVVRETNTNEMGSSSPCEDCHRKLLSLGIKKIVYSEDSKTLKSCRTDEYVPYGVSLGRRYIENKFEHSKRREKNDHDHNHYHNKCHNCPEH